MSTTSSNLASSPAPIARDPGASAALSIFVVIPTHGRPTLLGRTIDSILACDAPPARQVQLIVVENGPKSDAEQVVAPKASWLTPEYRHVATASKSAALNSVLHELDECLMIFFDDDIRVEPTILQEHSVAACVSSSGGFFGGGMPVHEEPPSEWLLNYLTFSARGWHSDAAFDAGLGGGLAFLGCSWSSLASDLRAVGGSDRRFGPGAPQVTRGTSMRRKPHSGRRGWNSETRTVLSPATTCCANVVRRAGHCCASTAVPSPGVTIWRSTLPFAASAACRRA